MGDNGRKHYLVEGPDQGKQFDTPEIPRSDATLSTITIRTTTPLGSETFILPTCVTSDPAILL